MDLAEYERTLSMLVAEIEHARLLYAGAKLAFKRAAETQRDLGAGNPDGNIRHAMTLQNEAFYEYSKALSRYNRFILEGKLNEEEIVGD
jgi:hypothetical protein